MRYPDLIEKAKKLPAGKHILSDLKSGKIILHNLGIRHMYMANQDEYRLLLEVNGREYAPRHGDFFTDFQLKLETKPDQRLALMDACELVCNEADPADVIKRHNFPESFASENEENWSLQTSAYQTGGLPTEMLLYGLQAMILVYHLNDPASHAPEAFRKVFVDMSHGISQHEATLNLKPSVRPGKRYFDRIDHISNPK